MDWRLVQCVKMDKWMDGWIFGLKQDDGRHRNSTKCKILKKKMQMHQKSKPWLHDYTAQQWKPNVIKKWRIPVMYQAYKPPLLVSESFRPERQFMHLWVSDFWSSSFISQGGLTCSLPSIFSACLLISSKVEFLHHAHWQAWRTGRLQLVWRRRAAAMLFLGPSRPPEMSSFSLRDFHHRADRIRPLVRLSAERYI